MPNRTIPLFVNPVAGRGRARKHLALIAGLFADEGVNCEMLESNGVGDIECKVFTAAMAGADRVVVAGGDGSIHEAVNGILRAKTATALGVIPLGTGNDFAKACAIPLTWRLAAGELASRLHDNIAGRKVDIGRVNDRFFANSVGIGFGAKINEIARGNRLPIGSLNYLAAVFQGVWDGVITPAMRIRYDDIDIHEIVTLVEVCNGATVGGMFRMAPMARNHDGVLDLVCVQPVSRPRIFTLLPRLLRGSHLGAPEVLCVPVASLHLHADGPVPAHFDGEIQAPGSEFSIEILPGALEIL